MDIDYLLLNNKWIELSNKFNMDISVKEKKVFVIFVLNIKIIVLVVANICFVFNVYMLG